MFEKAWRRRNRYHSPLRRGGLLHLAVHRGLEQFEEPLEGILAAVRAAGRGETGFRPEQVERAQRWWEEVGRKWESLTEREREMLARMAEGKSNREIAADLWIAEKTVEKHVGRILEKLGVNTRVEAAIWAVRGNLRRGGKSPQNKGE